MCRIIFIAVGLLLANLGSAAFLHAQVPSPRSDPQLHEGMVVSAGNGQVSLRGADGKEHAFKANALTRIMIHGKPGKLEDLKPGEMIRVMVDGKGMVTSISTVDDRKRI